MRIGIYNRWLSILGGGERYMLELALALRGCGHEVELLSQRLVEPAQVRERLGLDIDALRLRQLPDEPSGAAATEASGSYDLFINASHGDLLPARARRSWLVVFFPETSLESHSALPSPYVWRGGYAEELDGRRRPFRWLAPEGALWLPPLPGWEIVVMLERPADGQVELSIEGAASAAADLRAGRPARLVLPLPQTPPDTGVLLSWRAAALDLPDPRALGLRLLGVVLRRRRRFVAERARLQLPANRPAPAQALASYQRLLAISAYTAGWVARRWSRRAELLPPAVAQQRQGAKQPMILNVGRFFQGLHTKRHDVLIDAFRRLCSTTGGWRLHLAGGLDETNPEHCAYVDELRRAAADLPVSFHVNVSRERLAELYAGAALYWHAAGYGSDVERRPEAQEHFGITTVEAMSAGCVPLVYATGGPAEVVRDGVDGRHWLTPEALARESAALIAAPERRKELSYMAPRRAADFSPPTFAARVAQILAQEP